jgi:hypothetical protein
MRLPLAFSVHVEPLQAGSEYVVVIAARRFSLESRDLIRWFFGPPGCLPAAPDDRESVAVFTAQPDTDILEIGHIFNSLNS